MSDSYILKTIDNKCIKSKMIVYCILPFDFYIKKCKINENIDNFTKNHILIKTKSFFSFEGIEIPEINFTVWISVDEIYHSKKKCALSLLKNIKHSKYIRKEELQIFENSISEGKFDD